MHRLTKKLLMRISIVIFASISVATRRMRVVGSDVDPHICNESDDLTLNEKIPIESTLQGKFALLDRNLH